MNSLRQDNFLTKFDKRIGTLYRPFLGIKHFLVQIQRRMTKAYSIIFSQPGYYVKDSCLDTDKIIPTSTNISSCNTESNVFLFLENHFKIKTIKVNIGKLRYRNSQEKDSFCKT